MAQAIEVVFLPGTEKYPGGRIMARAAAGRQFFELDNGRTIESVGNVVRQYAKKLGWTGRWNLGQIANGNWVAVAEEHDPKRRGDYLIMT